MTESTRAERTSAPVTGSGNEAAAPAVQVLEQLAGPPDHVGLRRGTVEIDRSGQDDVVIIRADKLSVRVVMTERGPVFELAGAEVAVRATERIELSSRDVAIHASNTLSLSSDGDASTRVGGSRHTHVRGSERLEAGTVEVQANDADLGLRARGDVRVDGDHVHLNGLDVPAPFPWSEPAQERVAEAGGEPGSQERTT